MAGVMARPAGAMLLAVGTVALLFAVAWSFDRGEPSRATVDLFDVTARARQPAVLHERELEALLRAAGWPPWVLPEAVSVARCESRFQTFAVGDLGEVGLFQIHPVHHWRFESHFGWQADPFDPRQNAIVAREIWEKFGWVAWSCQPQ